MSPPSYLPSSLGKLELLDVPHLLWLVPSVGTYAIAAATYGLAAFGLYADMVVFVISSPLIYTVTKFATMDIFAGR